MKAGLEISKYPHLHAGPTFSGLSALVVLSTSAMCVLFFFFFFFFFFFLFSLQSNIMCI